MRRFGFPLATAMLAVVTIAVARPIVAQPAAADVGDATATADSMAAPDTMAAPDSIPRDVRIVCFEGSVHLQHDSVEEAASVPRRLDSNIIVEVGRGGSIELSVNGAIVHFRGRRRLRYSTIVDAAGDRSNAAVERSLLELDDLRPEVDSMMAAETLQSASRSNGDSTGGDLTGIGRLAADRSDSATVDDGSIIASAAAQLQRQIGALPDTLLILQPRSTTVLRAPLEFRWLRHDGVDTFAIRVVNELGQVVLRTRTRDTSFVWQDAAAHLFPGVHYTWTLADAGDTNRTVSARFHPADDVLGPRAESGESSIRLELGNDNPALAMLIGAHYQRLGFYNEASRFYTVAARQLPQQRRLMLALCATVYRSVGMTEGEILEAKLAALAERSKEANGQIASGTEDGSEEVGNARVDGGNDGASGSAQGAPSDAASQER